MEQVDQQASALGRAAHGNQAHHAVLRLARPVGQAFGQPALDGREDRGGSEGPRFPRLRSRSRSEAASRNEAINSSPTARARSTRRCISVRTRSAVETQNQIFRRAARHALQQNLQTCHHASPRNTSSKNSGTRFSSPMRGRKLCANTGLWCSTVVQRIERLQQRGEKPLQARFLRQAHKGRADKPLQIVVALDAQLRPGNLNRGRERAALERSVHVGEIGDANRRPAPRLEFRAFAGRRRNSAESRATVFSSPFFRSSSTYCLMIASPGCTMPPTR